MSFSTNAPSLQVQLAAALNALSASNTPDWRNVTDGVAPADGSRPFAAAFAAIAVAYSGGLDSSVLLHLTAAFAREYGVRLIALHVHHGLSQHADQWQAHCRSQCEQLSVAFDTCNVTLAPEDGGGVEEAARVARYHALGQLCRKHDVRLLLTAHHLDDQAETVLLQMLRGSGVAGLSGMDHANSATALLGNADLLMARPLLGASRTALEHYARQQALPFVDDESNRDTRFARNALRHEVMPVLAKFFPGFQERLSRTAGHAQSAQRLLTIMASQDMAACMEGEYLNVPALRRLDPERLDNVLRYWFAVRGVRMPSAAWLHELRTQLLDAKDDAQVCVTHADCHIRRYRNRVFMTPRQVPFDQDTPPQDFVWRGETMLAFPRFAGCLFFESGDRGVSAAWLGGQVLSLCLRRGGERVRLAWNRPEKSLKYHYQQQDIPSWERPYLPLILAGGKMLYAAGIGMDCRAQSDAAQDIGETDVRRIALRWQSDPG